jgi:hypothetical protein
MATKKAKTDEDPIWVCVDSLIHNGALFKHGDTCLASETEDVRRDQPASFLRWPAPPEEIRRANAAILRESWNRSQPERRRSGPSGSGHDGACW